MSLTVDILATNNEIDHLINIGVLKEEDVLASEAGLYPNGKNLLNIEVFGLSKKDETNLMDNLKPYIKK